MSVSDRERRLSDEAARRRRELREEQDRHEQTRALLRVANRQLLTAYLREWLIDPNDFLIVLGMGEVLDDRGAVVWERVDVAVRALLREKPHLGAPDPRPSRPRPGSALQWLLERDVVV